MTYRGSHLESRERYLAIHDAEETSRYDAWIASLSVEDHAARLHDLRQHVDFFNGLKILDVGAGTGALCLSLAAIPGIRLTALEPCAPDAG